LDFFNLFLINNYTRGIPIGATYALIELKLTREAKTAKGVNREGWKRVIFFRLSKSQYL